MREAIQKHGRLISLATAAAMLVSLLIVTGLEMNSTKATGEKGKGAQEENNKTADDISNMTGAAKEEILKLKSQGKTWTEVLENLKNRNTAQNQQQKDARSSQLAKTGLGEEDLKALKEEGFTDQEISEAKMLVERVVFELQEITEEDKNQVEMPKAEPPIPKAADSRGEEEEKEAYKELAGKVELGNAVRLVLKLKKEMGTMEAVLDEYLYALQIGINLEEYLTDREAYEKSKKEKGLGVNPQKMITIAKIEEKALEKIQKENTENKPAKEVLSTSGSIAGENTGKNPLPDVPKPEIKDVRPINPSDAIRQEIKGLNPNEGLQ